MRLNSYRNIALIALCMLLTGLESLAGNLPAEDRYVQTQALFGQAKLDYQHGRFEKALKAYQQVLQSGDTSAAIWYNMGNVYFRMHQLPAAALSYEKAHVLNPLDREIRRNIEIVRTGSADRIELLPEFFISKAWHAVLLSLHADTYAIICLMLTFIGSVLLVLYLFSGSVKSKKLYFFSAAGILLCALTALYMGAVRGSYFSERREAILFGKYTALRTAAGQQAPVIRGLHEATKVRILQRQADWLNVRLVNGNEGWIEDQQVEPVTGSK